MKRLGIFLLMLLLLSGCSENMAPNGQGQSGKTAVDSAKTQVPTEPADVAKIVLNTMSLQEQAAQLFFVKPEALSAQTVTKMDETMKEALGTYPVGGIILFANNIVSRQQVLDFNQALQEAAPTPLFLGVDEEGGRVARITSQSAMGYEKLPRALNVQTAEQAGEIGVRLGTILTELGFNLDFAPDADVFTNPQNTVIGDRAFSRTPEVAAEFVSAQVKGLHTKNIATAIKHFPGHGDTTVDSHKALPSVSHDLERLRQTEWVPFRAGIAAGTDMVMVGHIAVPNVTGTDEPSTLSETIVQDCLREELGFSGVIITDALDMGAVVERYGASDAAVRALQAGCDMLLMPKNFHAAYEGVLEAVQDGRISQKRLSDAVLHILQAKAARGLLDRPKIFPAGR